jgi:Tol biopolymer transport system component
LHILPATGFTGNTPDPALPQIKNPLRFGWASSRELYVSDAASLVRTALDGNSKTTVLNDPNAAITGIDYAPGRSLVVSWAGHRGNSENIWRADSDGSNQQQLTSGKTDFHPKSSSDGKWVYYSDFDAGTIKRVPSEGGTPQIVPGAAVPNAMIVTFCLSPDGKLLAFFSTRGGAGPTDRKIELVSVVADSKSEVRTLDVDVRAVRWLEFTWDGRAVAYPIRENGTDNIWLQPLDGARGRQITNFLTDSIYQFQFSPDGKKLGVIRRHLESDVVLLRDSGPSQ